ncbi:MAG: 50S ribosomal protein L24 [Candidatus Aenigmatarchaeota archaeon]
MNSKKPGKQRKALYSAPLHARQKLMAVHLTEGLRKQLGKRNLPVRKGDEVRVVRGEHRGTAGKVEGVDLKRLKVYIENVKVKKASGKEAALPFQPSKLMLTNLAVEDKERKAAIERKK